MGDGYRFDPAALGRVAATLRGGADALDAATGAQIEAPDAGASSDVVQRAMSGLLRYGVAGAQSLDQMADDVHANRGSYDDVENNNAGMLQREGQKGFGEMNIPLN